MHFHSFFPLVRGAEGGGAFLYRKYDALTEDLVFGGGGGKVGSAAAD